MQAGLVGWGEAMSSQAVYQVLVKYVPLRDKQKCTMPKKNIPKGKCFMSHKCPHLLLST